MNLASRRRNRLYAQILITLLSLLLVNATFVFASSCAYAAEPNLLDETSDFESISAETYTDPNVSELTTASSAESQESVRFEQAAETAQPENPKSPIEPVQSFKTSETSPHLTSYLDEEEKPLTGWVNFENNWYYFDNSSTAMESSWIHLDAWYYLGDDAKMKTGGFSDGNAIYTTDASGRMNAGSGWQFVCGQWYYLNQNSTAKTNWLLDRGTWYWLDPKTGAMATGWVLDGSDWYLCQGSGAMMHDTWFYNGVSWYWLGGSGRMATGWLWQSNCWYWLDPASGAMVTGWLNDGNTWYFTNALGSMATGWIQGVGPAWHWAEANGAMACGWRHINDTWYYFNPTEEKNPCTPGIKTVDNAEYAFDSQCGMIENTWVSRENGTKSYATKSGVLAFVARQSGSGGLQVLDSQEEPLEGWTESNGVRVYADPANNDELRRGWLDLEDTWYYFNNSYIMQTGWIHTWTWFLLGQDGKMLTGWQRQGNTWYHLANDSGAMTTGWLQENGTWYWLDSNGAMATGWRSINGKSLLLRF